MEQSKLLVVAMADQCRALIQQSSNKEESLPSAVCANHLLWMCDTIQQHAENWPATKLHRWIGFIQGGMIANRMLDLDGAKSMFDQAKNAYGNQYDDEDLTDHLDADSSFEFDIGGQG